MLHLAFPNVIGATSPAAIVAVTVLVAVEIGILVYALVDLARRPAAMVTGGNRLPWLLLCLLLQLVGPILYLAIGRQPQTVVEQGPRPLGDSGVPGAAGDVGTPPHAMGAAGNGMGTPGSGGVPLPVDPAGAQPSHVARSAAALYDAARSSSVAGAADAEAGTAGAGAATEAGAADAAVAGAAAGRSSASAVELTALRKVFGGTAALDGLTLAVAEGSVFGFLGPNGAGKTTTLRILAGLAHPSAGTARVLGHDATGGGGDLRAQIGYLPDVPAFYKWMTGTEYLRFAGSLFGFAGAALDKRVTELLDLAGLRGVDARIGGYSRGMKQRLGVAQALVNAPRLLLLDEPTSALDPIGRRDILDMVAALRGRTTVFFSTHILADVERVCDTVAIIDHGRVAALSGIDELRRRRGGVNRISIEVDRRDVLASALQQEAWVRGLQPGEGDEILITVDDLTAAQRRLPGLVAGLGLALQRMDNDEPSLEDVFVDLVEGRDA